MIRISKRLYIKLMALMWFYRQEAPEQINNTEILDAVYGRVANDDNHPLRRDLREMRIEGVTGTSAEIQEELREANENRELNEQDNLPIIERILQLVSTSWLRNRVSKKWIQDLRRAILTPEEQHELLAKLAQEELRCTCGHAFQGGEVVTFVKEIDRAPSIVCVLCKPPTQKRCGVSACDKTHAYALSLRKCVEHTQKPAREAQVIHEEVQEFAAAINLDLDEER